MCRIIGMEEKMKIGFIGLGNMACAMISGMLGQGIVSAEEICGSAKTQKTRDAVRERFGIDVKASNAAVAEEAQTLILAVKPQFLAGVIAEVRDAVQPDTLVISIAAGKTLAWLEEAFGRRMKMVRCMPNTPAIVGEGCTGVCLNGAVSEEEMKYSLRLMESFGKASLVEERLMDAVGAVSGSSPAYVFLFIEAMADAGVAAGAGIRVCGAGGIRQRKACAGDGKTSRRVKRYGMLSGGDDDRRCACSGGGRFPWGSDGCAAGGSGEVREVVILRVA